MEFFYKSSNQKEPMTSGKLLLTECVSILLILFTWITVNGPSFAQSGTQLDQTYTSEECGISIKFPSNWIIEELNDKYTTLMALANFQPDIPDGFSNTVELEAWDISEYPDKSIEGIAESEKEQILLLPENSI